MSSYPKICWIANSSNIWKGAILRTSASKLPAMPARNQLFYGFSSFHKLWFWQTSRKQPHPQIAPIILQSFISGKENRWIQQEGLVETQGQLTWADLWYMKYTDISQNLGDDAGSKPQHTGRGFKIIQNPETHGSLQTWNLNKDGSSLGVQGLGCGPPKVSYAECSC